MRRPVSLAAMIVGAALFLFTVPAHGEGEGNAQMQVGSSEGTDSGPAPTPTEGCETEEDWNPTVTCTVGPGEGIDELLQCLLDKIANPPPPCPDPVDPPDGFGGGPGGQDLQQQGGDDPDCSDPLSRADFITYLLAPKPPIYGIGLERLDGAAMERFTLREDDPGIQSVELQLDSPGRVARIGKIVDEPSKQGSVFLTLNRRTVEVETRKFPTSVELTAEIIRLLRLHDFGVVYQEPYLVVFWDYRQRSGITLVGFRSTDPAIVSSDLSLLPADEPGLSDTPIGDLLDPVIQPGARGGTP